MGLLSGLLNGFQGSRTRNKHTARLQAHCRELGWEPSVLDNGSLVLQFERRGLGDKTVLIVPGDSLTLFIVDSGISMVPERVPEETLVYLLWSNAKRVFGHWGVDEGEDGNAVFQLRYCTLTSGVDGPMVKVVCDAMLEEAFDFESKMCATGGRFS